MTQQTPSNKNTGSEQQQTKSKTNNNASLHQHTMNFLYQASNFMAHKGLNIGDQFPSGTNTGDIQLSKHYSNNMKRIAKKNVLRLYVIIFLWNLNFEIIEYSIIKQIDIRM